jgi:hypothetical protein
VTERVQAIIDEEVGGEVTIQPENLFSEDLIVPHLSVNRVRRGVGSSWSTKNQVLFFLSLSPSLCLRSANDVAGSFSMKYQLAFMDRPSFVRHSPPTIDAPPQISTVARLEHCTLTYRYLTRLG